MRRGSVWKRILLGLMVMAFIGSLLMNACLLALLGQFLRADGLDRSVVREGLDDQVVAIYEVSGVIDEKQARLAELFCRQIEGDANVKAVVLRVNSPGGYISPCDRMYRRLAGLSGKGKRLVVSMGGMAASGGYYISAPAQVIYAEPTTVTGSIGVIGSLIVLKGTLEKIGAEAIIVRSKKTRAWKAALNPLEVPAEYHIKQLQNLLDRMQERFEEVVRTGRGSKLKIETAMKTYTGADGRQFTIEETVPFNGRVFIAAEALELGLVDKVGYLDEAIDEAAALAGLSQPKVVAYRKPKGIFEQIGLARAGPVVDFNIIEEIQTPRLMMIWKVAQ